MPFLRNLVISDYQDHKASFFTGEFNAN